MRKGIVVIGLSLLLVACQSTAQEEVEEKTKKVSEVETHVAQEEAEEQVDQEKETESKEEVVEEPAPKAKSAEPKARSAVKEKEETSKWQKPNKIDDMDHLGQVHLAYDILEAQVNKDYAFLKDIASNEMKVDESKNRLIFDGFALDFFTEEDLGDIEYRFTHEDEGKLYVGLASVDYEKESSFVLEFQFIEEESRWKLAYLDMNK